MWKDGGEFSAPEQIYAAADIVAKLNAIDVLRATDPEFGCRGAVENAAANRYVNVVPYDHALLPGAYLNASLVPPLPDSQNRVSYIASQAPLPATFDTFFQHLYDQRTRVLVNLTPIEENGILKSDRYWPLETTAPLYTPGGQWTVTLLSSQSASEAFSKEVYGSASGLADVTVRNMRISTNGPDAKQHEFTQLHFTGWPDHGVLPPQAFFGLLEAIRALQETKETPVWVHCSAGIGRSGTVIGALLAQMQPSLHMSQRTALEQAAYVTAYMRKYRPGSVQSASQLLSMASSIDHIRLFQKQKDKQEAEQKPEPKQEFEQQMFGPAPEPPPKDEFKPTPSSEPTTDSNTHFNAVANVLSSTYEEPIPAPAIPGALVTPIPRGV